jgi:hypothetical protein
MYNMSFLELDQWRYVNVGVKNRVIWYLTKIDNYEK